MKVLDLIDIDKSDIKYQISNFPDGQKDIVININNGNSTVGQLGDLDACKLHGVQIKSRFNNAEDLLMIICATKALRNLGVKEIHLYSPYIMGLRSDRLFQEGGNRYVKDIVAPILNAQNYESVTCIDAHSSVAENCINNLVNIPNNELACWAIHDLRKEQNYVLVSPDAGASHKIYKLAEQIGYKGDIITCSKERDKDGKLTQVSLGFIPNAIFDKDLIVIDDICDGGQTFINIAKKFKETTSHVGKIYLIVTHGIFSKGFDELSKYFDGIYCTNSYFDRESISFEFGNPSFARELKFYQDKFKQLNVF